MKKVQTTIPTAYYSEKKMFSEMRWALEQVLCGYSDNSCKGTVNLFWVMFLNSKIAASMDLGRNKLKFIINHEFAPCFRNILLGPADFYQFALMRV